MYDPFEYMPYKLDKDRNRYINGYSPEEVLGLRFGVKHSKRIRREMAFDTILLILALGVLFYTFSLRRSSIYAYDGAFKEYMDGQLSHIRPQPEKIER